MIIAGGKGESTVKAMFPRWPTVVPFVLVLVMPLHASAQEADESITVAEPLTYTVVYSDSVGLSHFADRRINFGLIDYAPPAPPISVSQPTPAESIVYLSSPAGWYGDWHPTPKRQIFIYMAGEIEAIGKDVTRFKVGDQVMLKNNTVAQLLKTNFELLQIVTLRNPIDSYLLDSSKNY